MTGNLNGTAIGGRSRPFTGEQGLVVDFAMEVPQEELRAFMKKWGIAEDGECTRTLTRAEERQMEQENPLDGGFCAERC